MLVIRLSPNVNQARKRGKVRRTIKVLFILPLTDVIFLRKKISRFATETSIQPDPFDNNIDANKELTKEHQMETMTKGGRKQGQEKQEQEQELEKQQHNDETSKEKYSTIRALSLLFLLLMCISNIISYIHSIQRPFIEATSTRGKSNLNNKEEVNALVVGQQHPYHASNVHSLNFDRTMIPPQHPDDPATIMNDDVDEETYTNHGWKGKKYNSAMNFVFIVGLEGTGHHFMGSIIEASPSVQYLKDAQIHPRMTNKIAPSLFLHEKSSALFNSHCEYSIKSSRKPSFQVGNNFNNKNRNYNRSNNNSNKATPTTLTLTNNDKNKNNINNRRNMKMVLDTENNNNNNNNNNIQRRLSDGTKEWVDTDGHHGPDINVILEKTSTYLKQIEDLAQESQRRQQERSSSSSSSSSSPIGNNTSFTSSTKETTTTTRTTTTTMALNTWYHVKDVGMISYPNFRGDCRAVNYPNIDLYYQACDMAKVDCSHVYIFRDPYAVIKSTRRRNIITNVLKGLHLYTTHLNTILSQFYSHPHQIAGCWDLYKYNATYENDWSPISNMFGWKNRQDFESTFHKIYKAPSSHSLLTTEEKEAIVPKKFEPYLRSYLEAHYRVIDLCRHQLANKEKEDQGY